MAAILNFGLYPQGYFPQLAVTAIAVPGKEIGDVGQNSERFLDNKRIEGTLSEMLAESLNFCRRNMKVRTIINPETGERTDKPEYPVEDLGKAKPDLRNPTLATMSEFLLNTENRYSGIPTIRREMAQAGLPAPVFINRRNEFIVILYNKPISNGQESPIISNKGRDGLLEFCKKPRTRQEIADFLKLFILLASFISAQIQ